MSNCRCDNCDWTGPAEKLACTLEECEGLNERLDAGSVVPAGDCPECGCFAYLEPDPGALTFVRFEVYRGICEDAEVTTRLGLGFRWEKEAEAEQDDDTDVYVFRTRPM